MRHLPSLALLALLSCSSGGAPQDARPTDLFELEGTAADDSPLARVTVVKRQDASYNPWHLEFDTAASCAAFQVPGTHVITRFDRWLDVFVPTRFLVQNAVKRAPGLVWHDMNGTVIVPPPPPPPVEDDSTRALTEQIVRGGLDGYKGKGVTVAIVDSGLDFRHPDFINPDGTSRVKFFWDAASQAHTTGVGRPGPVTYPNGVAIGTVYSREDLTADLRGRKLGATDLTGHGTSCGSIAAGNGAAYPNRRYTGVAPEADLVVARIGSTAGNNMENAYLLGAICAWVDAVAGKAPAVLSCSFGGQYAGRDGTFVMERQLDARFAASVKGRAIVIAAGNDAQRKLHAETPFKGEDAPGTIEWSVPAGSRAVIMTHFTLGSLADVGWKSVEGKTAAAPGFSDVHGLTRQARMQFVTGPGDYAMQFWSKSGTAATVDAYIGQLNAGAPPLDFKGASAKLGKQVGCPGTTLQAVTVGSYDFNAQVELGGKILTVGFKNGDKFIPLPVGFLSSYSNHGPRRTGDLKPDLVAPGQFHTAARSADKVKTDGERIETSGKYTYFNGTSAATPYAAGVIALMLQKNPNLTVGEIRSILHKNMSRDAQTGAVPNAAWGHGKMDVRAVQAALAAVKAP